jgi:hypothetical protein
MVLTEKTETQEVIFTGKKKYKRVFLKHGVEWRRFKTNNQVTREQQKALEEEYKINFTTNVVRSRRFDIKNDNQRVNLENNLVVASNNGKMKLVGVKRVKEITGWGLKESKEYVDEFFRRRDLYNNL